MSLLQLFRRGPVREPRAVPPPMAAPATEEIRFTAWCARTRQPFVIVARREGDTLHWISNELIPANGPGGTGPAVRSMAVVGNFKMKGEAWPGCPLCGTRTSKTLAEGRTWMWQCAGSCGTRQIHCGGDVRGWVQCACGRERTDRFVTVNYMGVTGERAPPAAAAIRPAAAPVPGAAPSPASNVLALPPPRLPRIR